MRQVETAQSPIDRYLLERLDSHGLSFAAPADRAQLVRRLTLLLTGLPPTLDEVRSFVEDSRPDASERRIDWLLASPRYGERWGKFWLDVVGYADSNGYFNADTDRPLAYAYRDYVIRAWNEDRPYAEFVREQLAGDELAGLPPLDAGAVRELPAEFDERAVERTRELLIASHFLRNAQDGTGESDGNPDEQTVDRATPLEGCVQLTCNAFLSLNIQCARCHEHKFEPIGQDEYYGLQAIFYPVFPAFHPDRWVKPKDRFGYVASNRELRAWESRQREAEARMAAARRAYQHWWRTNRPAGLVLFQDAFDGSDATVARNWTNTLPGDDVSAGTPPVALDSQSAPAAYLRDGMLVVLESGAAGDRWLATRQAFDWTPERIGDWLQVTFDLIADRADMGGRPAERVAFGLALHDFNDNSPIKSGSVLIDGNPAGGAMVHLDYPGADSTSAGQIGAAGYRSGHNYGVRITRLENDQFRLEHLVDGAVEGGSLTLRAEDLPDGAFGFGYCCNRSFVVDNVVLEGATSERRDEFAAFAKELAARKATLDQSVREAEGLQGERPGMLATVGGLVWPVPEVFVLSRGNYKSPAAAVAPAGLRVLSDGDPKLRLSPSGETRSDRRRLAFADWLTAPDSRAASLLARVLVNRIWQHNFEFGLVANPGNFGVSGQRPSHPELLEYLAGVLVESGGRTKSLQRRILVSAVAQQSSWELNQESASTPGLESWQRPAALDPENRLLWRYPARRLDAEAYRDSLLAIAGQLDLRMYGPYTPTERQGDGGVVVPEQHPGARRRAVYLQQRRSQVESFLEVFDAPSLVTTCPQRPTSTVPLQSLTLLNSDWMRQRALGFAAGVLAATTDPKERIDWAFRSARARSPSPAEQAASLEFLRRQADLPNNGGELSIWTDFCQMILSANFCSYLE